ncbi:MAG: histidine phosphatase family protein [Planctomycetota bacterium]
MRLRTEQRAPRNSGLGNMTRLYLLKTGQTVWEQQGRVDSAAGEPLTELGVSEVASAMPDLDDAHIKAVYAGTGEAEGETAKLIADHVGVKVNRYKDLRELDYGLWQGLTGGEIKRRQPKVYRQWVSAPDSVRPPEGETLEEARNRMVSAAKRIIKRHKGAAAVVVCRPVALAILKCALSNVSLDTLWQQLGEDAGCVSFDTDEKSL